MYRKNVMRKDYLKENAQLNCYEDFQKPFIELCNQFIIYNYFSVSLLTIIYICAAIFKQIFPLLSQPSRLRLFTLTSQNCPCPKDILPHSLPHLDLYLVSAALTPIWCDPSLANSGKTLVHFCIAFYII